MKTALVIGGTGPTGPHIVNGLCARGHSVTVLHTGAHAIDLGPDVRHIHADPHFRETLVPALKNAWWDVVIASYGRLQIICDVLKGRTGRVVGLGGSTGALASAGDPRWGSMGPSANLDEAGAILETDPQSNRFAFRMAQAEAALFQAHDEGHYNASYLAFPILYGSRQPGPQDWCIVRRVLDDRRQFIVADGGLKLEARAYAENAAHAVLLAVDQPEIAAGQRYVVGDDALFTMRQRIEAYARCLGHAFEFVDMPYDAALPCHVLWRRMRASRFRDTGKIRHQLGYRDQVGPLDAIQRSIDWLLHNRSTSSGEWERQLGDPFDYLREDRLIAHWRTAMASLPAPDYPISDPRHIYRHPKTPDDGGHAP